MTIPHFAASQNDVFVPALLAALAATVLICLPVVFAQALRRTGRLRAVTVVAGILAAVALVLAGWQAAVGVRTLDDQTARVRAELQQRYGIAVTRAQAAQLLEGGAPRLALPRQAQAAGLPKPTATKSLQLKPAAPGARTYDVVFGGTVLRAS